MNYPAASRNGRGVRSKLLAMNRKRFKFYRILRASLRPLSNRFFVLSGRLGGQVNGPRALPAPTRISPAPTTEQKQHYNNDQ